MIVASGVAKTRSSIFQDYYISLPFQKGKEKLLYTGLYYTFVSTIICVCSQLPNTLQAAALCESGVSGKPTLVNGRLPILARSLIATAVLSVSEWAILKGQV
jgi:hypothetical protein